MDDGLAPTTEQDLMELLRYTVGDALADWLDALGCGSQAGTLRGGHRGDDLTWLAHQLVAVAERLRRKLMGRPQPLDGPSSSISEAAGWATLVHQELCELSGLYGGTTPAARRADARLRSILVRLAGVVGRELSGTPEGLVASLVGRGVPVARARTTVAVATR